MRRLLIYIMLLANLFSFAQQTPVFSSIGTSNFVYNPAYTGSEPYLVTNLRQRLRFTGIKYAPNTQYLDVHTSISNKNFGIGGFIYHETLGVLGKINGSISYGYHVRLGDNSKLSFGIAGHLNQNRIIASRIIVDSQNDNLLNLSTNARKSFFGADAGILLHGSTYKLGVSFLNLYNTPYEILNGSKLDALMHINLEYGLGLYVGNKGMINISGRNVFTTLPLWSQFDLMYDHDERFFFGLGYRWEDALIATVGLKVVDELQVYYSYDFGIGQLSNTNNGSHEISLRYHFHYDPMYSKDKARYSNKVYRGRIFSFKRKPKAIIKSPELEEGNND